jgi:hypothetical protein
MGTDPASRSAFSSHAGQKFNRCHIGYYMDVAWSVQILIKNKLQNPSVNRETNLLRLINPSLAHITVPQQCQIMD